MLSATCGETLFAAGVEKFRDHLGSGVSTVWRLRVRGATAVWRSGQLPGFSTAWRSGIARKRGALFLSPQVPGTGLHHHKDQDQNLEKPQPVGERSADRSLACAFDGSRTRSTHACIRWLRSSRAERHQVPLHHDAVMLGDLDLFGDSVATKSWF